MAATKENRQKFIKNLLNFMGAYNFDGVDLDWEVSDLLWYFTFLNRAFNLLLVSCCR